MTGRLSLLVLLLLTGCGAAPVASDAALVYCLNHRSETVGAAAALHLVDSTSIGNKIQVGTATLEFDEWRRTRQQGFEKACAAAAEPHMRPQTPPSTPAWVSTAITVAASLFSVFLGAWISWVTTNRREDRTRAKDHSVALRRASRGLVDEVRDYGDAQLKGQASAVELRRKRDHLNTQLAVTKLMRPEWSAPDLLRTELDAFGDSVEEGWKVKDDKRERQSRVAAVTQAVRALDDRVEVVVQALQRPRDANRLLDAEFKQVTAG